MYDEREGLAPRYLPPFCLLTVAALGSNFMFGAILTCFLYYTYFDSSTMWKVPAMFSNTTCNASYASFMIKKEIFAKLGQIAADHVSGGFLTGARGATRLRFTQSQRLVNANTYLSFTPPSAPPVRPLYMI